MRKAHREAAKALYEERNQHLISATDPEEEFYIDLHGLHPEEAVEYLENVLVSHAKLGGGGGGSSNSSRRVVYAITGTGHHSKNGKDKVGKAVRNWLNELEYTFREFSVPGERGGYVGGVLGIEATSGARRATAGKDTSKDEVGPVAAVGGKIQVLKRTESATS
jgi:DNA-nicking Smr family endonuclease